MLTSEDVGAGLARQECGTSLVSIKCTGASLHYEPRLSKLPWKETPLTVTFEPRSDRWYVVSFPYDAHLVELVKNVPPTARSWDPQAREWTVHASYAAQLGLMMQQSGYAVTGAPSPFCTQCGKYQNAGSGVCLKCKLLAHKTQK